MAEIVAEETGVEVLHAPTIVGRTKGANVAMQHGGHVRTFLNQSASKQLKNIIGGSKSTAIARNAKKSFEAGLKRKEQVFSIFFLLFFN